MVDSSARIEIPTSVLDQLLTAQFAIAWAGEGGEESRLGWWRTDLQSEFGGEDLFRRLLPHTWEWAIFQSLREAARRRDSEIRAEAHDAEEIVSLFYLGFDVDERVDDRLADLKRSRVAPAVVLPGLQDVVLATWNLDQFVEWLDGHGSVDFTNVPAGRRLKGKQPDSLELTVSNLLAAFKPLSDSYPLPHYRRAT
jgi:hypothetical protein